jgi:hypothetical protein
MSVALLMDRCGFCGKISSAAGGLAAFPAVGEAHHDASKALDLARVHLLDFLEVSTRAPLGFS